jgi:hypothetical protein
MIGCFQIIRHIINETSKYAIFKLILQTSQGSFAVRLSRFDKGCHFHLGVYTGVFDINPDGYSLKIVP